MLRASANPKHAHGLVLIFHLFSTTASALFLLILVIYRYYHNHKKCVLAVFEFSFTGWNAKINNILMSKR